MARMKYDDCRLQMGNHLSCGQLRFHGSIACTDEPPVEGKDFEDEITHGLINTTTNAHRYAVAIRKN